MIWSDAQPDGEELARAYRAVVEKVDRIRRRRRLGWGSAAAVGVAIAVSIPLISFPAHRSTTVNVSPIVGPGTTTGPSRPTVLPFPASPWPQAQILPGGFPSAAVDASDVYVDQVPDPAGHPAVSQVVRLDPATLARQASSSSLPAGQLIDTGQSLWLVPSDASSGIGLYRLDPETLAVQQQIELPSTSPMSVAVAAWAAWAPVGGLWVARGDVLYHLDPDSGALVGNVAVSGAVSSVTMDDHGRLYDSAGMVIEQRDSSSGDLRTQTTTEAVGRLELSATDVGVWASYRSGMDGSSALYAADTLDDIGPPWSPEGQTPFSDIMGAWATVTGGAVWVTTDQSLTCADPNSFSVRASDINAPEALAADGRVLLGVNGSGLVAVTPPSTCWGQTTNPTTTETTVTTVTPKASGPLTYSQSGLLMPSGWNVTLPLTNDGGPASWAQFTGPSPGEQITYKLSGGEFGLAYRTGHQPNPNGLLPPPSSPAADGPAGPLAPCTVTGESTVDVSTVDYQCVSTSRGTVTQGSIYVEAYPQGYKVLQVTLPTSESALATQILNSLALPPIPASKEPNTP